MRPIRNHYRVHFVNGAFIDIITSNEKYATILAQAEGIGRCWDIDVATVECIKADRYYQQQTDNWL
jgi:hypothetical protein